MNHSVHKLVECFKKQIDSKSRDPKRKTHKMSLGNPNFKIITN